MSPVHKLSAMGSITSNKIDYPSMLAGYGDFGAYQRIGFARLNSAGGFIFSNIPQNFQDLELVVFPQYAGSGQFGTYMLLNDGTAGSVTSITRLYGNGSGAVSDRLTNQSDFYMGNMPGVGSVFGAQRYYFLNYANTSTFKTVLGRVAQDENGSGNTFLSVGLSRSTSAITKITLGASSYINMSANSTAALYGVKASAA